MWAGGLLSASINFLCRLETFCPHPSTLLAAHRPSVNFRQLSVHPGKVPSTHFNIPCGQEITQLPSNFCAARRPSIKICKISVRPGDLQSTSVNSSCGWETLDKFPSTLCVANNCLSTFRAAGRSSIKFPNERGCSVNICQLSKLPGDLA